MYTLTENRLANSRSPYLQGHSNDPINWHEWNSDSLEKAERENKPIFLSIGYSACHWCHVMQEEVFSRSDIAKELNENYIPILVDREERADIDALFMEACTLLTGNGGWPLNAFLTPEKKPFFASSYLNYEQFYNILGQITESWQTDKQGLEETAKQIISTIYADQFRGSNLYTKAELCDAAYNTYAEIFDNENGGFSAGPKFPMHSVLMFLQRFALRYNLPEKMVKKTLEAMSLGGIHDQIEGGFFRYTTDKEWLKPHYEKMTSDNAMFALIYAENGEEEIARKTLDFCKNTLRSASGGYYSSTDADSGGFEGAYYLYDKPEIYRLLGSTDSEKFCKIYNIKDFASLPYLTKKPKDEEFLEACKEKLLSAKEKTLNIDNKVLCGDNGLMLAALSTCGRLFVDSNLIGEALNLAFYIRQNFTVDDRLVAYLKDGEASGQLATANDYTRLAWGVFRLHQATLDPMWLSYCQKLCDDLLYLFADTDGVLTLSGQDVTDIPLKTKPTADEAMHSANGLFCGLLERLFVTTGEMRYKQAYDKLSSELMRLASVSPANYASFLSAVLCEDGGVCVHLPTQNPKFSRLCEDFQPFCSFVMGEEKKKAVVCTNDKCFEPTERIGEVKKIMRKR